MGNRSYSRSLLRGVSIKCPRCGEGRLLEKYLKIVDRCSECGEPFSHLPADDMPPWMTILLVGLIITPTMVLVNLHYEMETNVQLILGVSFALILTLFLLPRCKGFILALLWTQRSSFPENKAEPAFENAAAEEGVKKNLSEKSAIEYIGHFERYKVISGYKNGEYCACAYAGRHEVKSLTGNDSNKTVQQLKDFLQDRLDTFKKERDADGIPCAEEFLEAFYAIRDQIPKDQLRLLVFYACNRDTLTLQDIAKAGDSDLSEEADFLYARLERGLSTFLDYKHNAKDSTPALRLVRMISYPQKGDDPKKYIIRLPVVEALRKLEI